MARLEGARVAAPHAAQTRWVIAWILFRDALFEEVLPRRLIRTLVLSPRGHRATRRQHADRHRHAIQEILARNPIFRTAQSTVLGT